MSESIIGAFEIIGIRDAGNLAEERVLFRAIEPVSLEYYVVVNVKTTNGNKLIILNDKIFWFPIMSVNPGEFVRLYTKSGSYAKTTSTYGQLPATYHNYYWDLSAPIWDGVKSNAVTIFKVSNWNTAYQP
ncbi:MAG: hypothetical protein KAS46_05290 [Candidatus Aureabacteria bacterium]|nr:hypothetical protein [Candidatus Auribacterota bacterium]